MQMITITIKENIENLKKTEFLDLEEMLQYFGSKGFLDSKWKDSVLAEAVQKDDDKNPKELVRLYEIDEEELSEESLQKIQLSRKKFQQNPELFQRAVEDEGF